MAAKAKKTKKCSKCGKIKKISNDSTSEFTRRKDRKSGFVSRCKSCLNEASRSGNPTGRPQSEINYAVLDALCAVQCTGEECAGALDMDYDTLNRALDRDGNGSFTEYFSKKSQKGKVSLRRKQYTLASEGNATMCIWLGKNWLGQTDKSSVDISNEDGSLSKSTAILDAIRRKHTDNDEAE